MSDDKVLGVKLGAKIVEQLALAVDALGNVEECVRQTREALNQGDVEAVHRHFNALTALAGQLKRHAGTYVFLVDFEKGG